jgi:hypothetical protein
MTATREAASEIRYATGVVKLAYGFARRAPRSIARLV